VLNYPVRNWRILAALLRLRILLLRILRSRIKKAENPCLLHPNDVTDYVASSWPTFISYAN
jgi:hypothetical protein